MILQSGTFSIAVRVDHAGKTGPVRPGLCRGGASAAGAGAASIAAWFHLLVEAGGRLPASGRAHYPVPPSAGNSRFEYSGDDRFASCSWYPPKSILGTATHDSAACRGLEAVTITRLPLCSRFPSYRQTEKSQIFPTSPKASCRGGRSAGTPRVRFNYERGHLALDYR